MSHGHTAISQRLFQCNVIANLRLKVDSLGPNSREIGGTFATEASLEPAKVNASTSVGRSMRDARGGIAVCTAVRECLSLLGS